MLVEVPVSSIKTRRAGSSSPWCAFQTERAMATSGRSCSVAETLFFEADAESVIEAPHGCHADHNAALAQQSPNFFKRNVRLCPNQIEQPRGMALNNRAPMPSNRARRRASGKPPLLDPLDSAAGAHRK